MSIRQIPLIAFSEWLTQLPWVIVLLLAGPLFLLAWARGTFPTTRFTWPIALPTAVSILAVFNSTWVSVALLLDAFLLVIALIDLASLPDFRRLKVIRELPPTASLGAPSTATLILENYSTTSRFRGKIRDDLPEGLTCDPVEQTLDLPPSSREHLQYEITPKRRGAAVLKQVYIRLDSRWGLWQQFRSYPHESRLSVYPDIKQLARYSLLARTNRLSLIGVRQTRKAGQDNEFERLRDYTRDDHYRHIDWRSTARRNRLTVRQFQADQSQRLFIMLDCGRMMTNQHQGLSLLDHALNASLMLSNVALKQGDAVGMLCFSDKVHTFVPPRGGASQTNRLLHAAYDQFPRMVESRYDEAFLYLSNHCRRRSLVILCTHLIDQVNADQIHSYLSNLAGRHLPLAVLLRDRSMFEFADQPAESGLGLYISAAAAEMLCWRHQVITKLRHRGALVVDVFPDQLCSPLVNEYLAIKAKHLL
jgi:uncharacterized protein (DUF58 family)